MPLYAKKKKEKREFVAQIILHYFCILCLNVHLNVTDGSQKR